jgi:hypothetical protein
MSSDVYTRKICKTTSRDIMKKKIKRIIIRLERKKRWTVCLGKFDFFVSWLGALGALDKQTDGPSQTHIKFMENDAFTLSAKRGKQTRSDNSISDRYDDFTYYKTTI